MRPAPELKIFSARLSLPEGSEAQGTVEFEFFSPARARKRALRTWIYCWGAAIGAVFLPLLHFVLVPALLVAGPVVFLIMSRSRSRMLGGRGTCPGCQAEFMIGAGQTQERFYDLCTVCRREVTVEILQAGS
jgi:hypothetical protein